MPKVLVLKRFGYTQSEAAINWVINHELNLTHPVVDVWLEDESGNFTNSDAHEVTITSTNTVTINFDVDAVKGVALVT
jgi:hypothetical protein